MNKVTLLSVCVCAAMLFCSCGSSSVETAEVITQDTESVTSSAEVETEETTADTTTEVQTTMTAKAAEETTKKSVSVSATTGEKNALKTALNYLSVMPFSHDGLVDQLEYEGYSHSEAVYGADNCGADWNEQAEKSAAKYLDVMPFSRQGLIDQLIFEGFTQSQAEHGVSSCMDSGSDSPSKGDSSSTTTGEKNALKSAQKYIDVMPFSHDGLVKQLEFEGYSNSEALYGADNCGADWNEQAEKSAANYLKIMSFSRQGLIEQLDLRALHILRQYMALKPMDIDINTFFNGRNLPSYGEAPAFFVRLSLNTHT